MSFALVVMVDAGIPKTSFDGGCDVSGVETLCQQVPVYAPGGRSVGKRPVAKAPLECLLEQSVFVEFLKDLGDGGPSHRSCNAKPFDLPQHASPSAVPDPNFRAGTCERGAAIVDRPLASQARDRAVDVVGLELTTPEALTHLGF
jgi:hypothetical protein